MLKGEKVNLRPTTKDEIPIFYKWATESDATPFWYGDLYDDKIPSFEKFTDDWKEHYFNDENPELGRSFSILKGEEPIGQINYNSINPVNKRVEIDILITDSKNWGKGYGSDAIRTLIKYLFDEIKVKEVWVAAIKKNPRAVKAYQKAGMEIIKPYNSIKNDPHWKNKDLNKWVFLSYKR